MNYKRRRDLECNFPAIWIEIAPQNKGSILICNVYREWKVIGQEDSRQVGPTLERWSKFIEKFKEVAETSKEFHVMGDMNLDWNRWRQNNEFDPLDDVTTTWRKRQNKGLIHQACVDLLHEEILSSESDHVAQMINEDTHHWKEKRTGIQKSSRLDLYFTNRPQKMQEARVVKCAVAASDHHLIMGFRRSTNKLPQKNISRGRRWNKIDWREFEHFYIQSGVRTDVRNTNTVHAGACALNGATSALLDSQQRVKTYQLRKNHCPYVDEATRMAIKRKDELYKLKMNSNDPEVDKLYKKQSNFVARQLAKKRRHYNRARLRSTIASKDMWRAAKQQVGWEEDTSCTSLLIDGNLTNNGKIMAEHMNTFFVEKVEKIREKIPESNIDPLEYTREFIGTRWVPEFRLSTVTEYDVIHAIGQLKNSDACGTDEVSNNALKKMKEIIAPELTRLFNRSILQGEFPDLWKIAKVICLHKKNGSKLEAKFYRPIALLPVFGKLLERLVNFQVMRHFESSGLFTDKQNGYRRRRSTTTSHLQLQEEILNDFEDDYDNVVVALDNSAAFDTVDHKILLQKLKLYGFHESAIKWFTSYLSNRYQYVEIKGKKSSVRKIKTGIFQGSVLGPTLYIIYTNCITVHEDKITSLSQYADDGSIRQRLSRRHAVNQVNIQNKVTQIQKYMDANKLKLNIEKTQMMVVKKGSNNLHSGLHL